MITFTIKDWDFISKEKAEQLFELIAKDWKYEIKKVTKKRTNDQNRYLWSWVYWTIDTELKQWTDYIHWVMSYKFLLDQSGKSPYVRSTTSLNTVEFSNYIESIGAFVADFGIIIPSSEQYFNSN